MSPRKRKISKKQATTKKYAKARKDITDTGQVAEQVVAQAAATREALRQNYASPSWRADYTYPSSDDAAAVGMSVKTKLDSAGRLLVPASFRKALDVESGDEVRLSLKGNRLEIRSLVGVIREAQTLVQQYVQKTAQGKKGQGRKPSLVDELLSDRREEYRKEHREAPKK